MAKQYEVRAVPAGVLEELRVNDDAGRVPRVFGEEQGGRPLRCCLRRSRRGEQLVLVSYAPLRRWACETGADPGAYDEVGPVFVHATGCGGFAGTGFPDAMLGDRRVARAYSAAGVILGGRYVCSSEGGGERVAGVGVTMEEELDSLYRDADVAVVHVRAVEFGCFLFETRRRM